MLDVLELENELDSKSGYEYRVYDVLVNRNLSGKRSVGVYLLIYITIG